MSQADRVASPTLTEDLDPFKGTRSLERFEPALGNREESREPPYEAAITDNSPLTVITTSFRLCVFPLHLFSTCRSLAMMPLAFRGVSEGTREGV